MNRRKTAICCVLAGGRSRRMGCDKALLRVGGKTMLERALALGGGVAERIIVLGRVQEEGVEGVEWRTDPVPFGGAMSALADLLRDTEGEVVVLGCDMPLVGVETVWELVAAHRESGGVATFAKGEGDWIEPTLAVLMPGVVPLFQEMIETRKGAFQPLVGRQGVKMWQMPRERWGELLNVNEEGALAEARRVLGDQ